MLPGLVTAPEQQEGNDRAPRGSMTSLYPVVGDSDPFARDADYRAANFGPRALPEFRELYEIRGEQTTKLHGGQGGPPPIGAAIHRAAF